MEDLFEFLFGSSGRIDRTKYWRSLLSYSIAGLLAAVILFTAAGLAAPLFIITVVLVFIPWLQWGFAITTERLHDRDKSAWWPLVFYLLPAVTSHLAHQLRFAGGSVPQYILAAASFPLTLWGLVEIGILRGTPGPNKYVPDPLVKAER